jgi:glucan phosphorylase
MHGRLEVVFLPEDDLTLAERLSPACEVSNPISTAGYEARGTSQSYLEADQRVGELYSDTAGWARQVSFNVAGSGRFSSDRIITEYAADIWNATLCPVP